MILKIVIVAVFVILMTLLGAAVIYAMIDDKYDEEDRNG